jgi:hypothetical protein
LVEAIRLCAEKRVYDCPELLKVWTTHQKTFVLQEGDLAILELLADISFENIVRTEISTKDAEPSEVSQLFMEIGRDRFAFIDKYKDTYSWFLPSIDIRICLKMFSLPNLIQG